MGKDEIFQNVETLGIVIVYFILFIDENLIVPLSIVGTYLRTK